MLYVITATITKLTKDGTITKQIPTFYLDSDVQGIVSAEHAEKIAETIINPFNNWHATSIFAQEVKHVGG